jgi:hypothetical protein
VTCDKLGVAAGRKLPIVLAVLFTLFNITPASAELWHLLHQEVGDALAELSERYFAGPVDSREASASLLGSSERPWAIVVGFTGGFETKQSNAWRPWPRSSPTSSWSMFAPSTTRSKTELRCGLPGARSF